MEDESSQDEFEGDAEIESGAVSDDCGADFDEETLMDMDASGALDDVTIADEPDAALAEVDGGSAPDHGPGGTRKLPESFSLKNGLDLSGAQVGEYRLVRKIAKGGMGEVYEGVQLALDRRVAVKIIADELVSDVSFIQRFEREAKSSAALNHPNVAQVYDFGREGERLYLVMEFVEGEDLAAHVKHHGKLSIPEAMMVGKQVVAALKFALDQSIIHRDIKPANILYTPEGVVKITDLGLAKKLTEESDVTLTGTGIGSPHYLAPEQADDARAVDHRADIYALGITLMFLLTGRRPFEGESAFAVVLAHANKPLPTGEDLGTPLPDEVEALIRRMTAKNPVDRHMDYDELLADLELVEAGASPTEPSESGSGESKVAVLAMVASLVVVVVLLGMVFQSPPGGEKAKLAKATPESEPIEEDPVSNVDVPDQPLPPAGSDEANKLLKEKLKALIGYQLPEPPVIPKDPLPDASLQTMLAQADRYALTNPTDFQHIIARYDQVVRKAAGAQEEEAIKKTRGDWEIRFFAADAIALGEFKAKVQEAFYNRRPHECFKIWRDFPTNLLSEAILDEAVDQIIGARGPFITEVAHGELRGLNLPPELKIPRELIPEEGVYFDGPETMRGAFTGPGSQGGPGGAGGQRGLPPRQFGGGNNRPGPGPGGRPQGFLL